uniref:SCP domain-containing protein n=1 Tax=Strongyloides papillosus TaxID=174720 RepID=A0A0N5B1X3_STREA
MDPPPLPKKTKSYIDVRESQPLHSKHHIIFQNGILPPLPLKHRTYDKKGSLPLLPLKRRTYGKKGSLPLLPLKRHGSSKKGSPPQLPSKRNSYEHRGNKIVIKPQVTSEHKVKSYTVRGMAFFECNQITFLNHEQAKQYCESLNASKGSKVRQNLLHHTPIIENHRPSLVSNDYQLYRKKSVSVPGDFPTGRKNFLSVSSVSQSGLSKSSSRHSLTESNNDLLSRRDSVFESNTDLLSERNSISGSRSSLSGRGSSLSTSRNRLSSNIIDNEISKGSHDKHTKNKLRSQLIWLKAWELCNLKCYSANNYEVYKQRFFNEINMYRSLHKVTSLELSAGLSVLAQKIADEYAARIKFNVDEYPNYGILYGRSRVEAASTILKSWYDKNEKYNFFWGKTSSKSALSFTQIVWATTNKFGIGVQHDNGYLFVVCVFFPKGNQKGKYKKNVHKWKN